MSVPADITAPPHGGHALPAHIAGASAARTPAPRPRRRPRRGVVIGVAGAVLLAGAIGATQVAANLGYDEAASGFDDAYESTQTSFAALDQATTQLAETTDVANQLTAGDAGTLTDPAAKETLTAAVAAAGETQSAAHGLLAADLPDAGAKPTFFWELFGATEQLHTHAQELDGLSDDADAESPSVADADSAIDDAGIAYLGSAATAASSFEAAHLSARNDDVIALRDAASTLSLARTLDASSVDSFLALQDAANQVVASEQAELAEKAGPLMDARLEVEAFARSLAPGVLLEFDWNPTVNGAGDNGSMGGLTTWWWDEPDRAVIELSNSVAEQWPAERSRALVAHEVGHAISVKCEDMYDSSTQDSIEKWATAWAISMGFTDDANGVWAYGYPPQSYIDAAYGCR
ncbi:hypothetical protein [Microbacterium sp. NPDC089695]|uniref:hypothetical protein n=1 Tax=Microbacterium sp. NPDC089695 TaxID=3364198 RepID=UPI00381DB69A